MTNPHKTEHPKRKSKQNRVPLPTSQAYARLLIALIHVESICRVDPREFSVQLPTQHRDVPYWVNAHICYSGVEQAMKMFLPADPETDYSHNLWALYQTLTNTAKCTERKKQETAKSAKIAIENINSYYRAYHSFHHWSDRPKEKTAPDFLQKYGGKYANWRYTLREVQDHPSMIHSRFMIEIWRSLLKSGNGQWFMGSRLERIDGRIRHFFGRMFSAAHRNQCIMASERGEYPARWLDDWIKSVGGELVAGLWVFRHLQCRKQYPFEVESEIKECVLQSARAYRQQIEAETLHTSDIFDTMPDQPERCDEIYRMHLMCLDGLRWNAELGVFETKEEYTEANND